MKENEDFLHFFFKIFGHIKKKQYLCIRFRERKCAGCSSARLECLLWEQEVVSSNLAYPTNQKKPLKNEWLLCFFELPKIFCDFFAKKIHFAK